MEIDEKTIKEQLSRSQQEIDLERAFARVKGVAQHLAAILEIRGINPQEILRPECLRGVEAIDRALVDRYGEDYRPEFSHSYIVAMFDRVFATDGGHLRVNANVRGKF